MKTKGFLPCCPEGAHTLILGSFPSVKSRETDFYYGHPRNRFWATLAEYFSSPVPVTVEDKKSFLAAHGIALWDVVTECDIKGSEDASIRDYTVADSAHPSLAPVVCALPSTSPANPRFDKRVWFEALDTFRPQR